MPGGHRQGPADRRPPAGSRPLRVRGCWVSVVIFSDPCRQFRGRGFVAVLLAKSQPCQQFIQLCFKKTPWRLKSRLMVMSRIILFMKEASG